MWVVRFSRRFNWIRKCLICTRFACRARFTKSYSWRDSERFGVERADADSKTWISEVGLGLPIDIAIYIGVLDADGDAVIRCPSDVPSCFASGVVKVTLCTLDFQRRMALVLDVRD